MTPTVTNGAAEIAPRSEGGHVWKANSSGSAQHRENELPFQFIGAMKQL